MQKSTAKLALAATTALAGFTTPALAQDSGANDIVVTARRVEERLQDVPISITVFNQQQLSDRNVTNAQDLANYTPSLSVTTGFGSENSTFALRGFVQETGTAPSVGVYFADVVAPRGASQGFPAGDGAGPGSFFDLQNVQVLKGPQGTLFGRNTTGGAILLVPQKPTDKFEGYVEGSLGNYNMRRIQAVVNVPVSDTIRLRLGGDHQQRDGYMKNVLSIGAKDFDDINYIALRGSLVIDVSPDIENYTIASFVDSDNNGHLAKTVACNPSNPLVFTAAASCPTIAAQDAQGFFYLHSDFEDPYSKMRNWQVINTTRWQVNDNLAVKNIFSYAQLWTKQNNALFGTNFVIPASAFGPSFPSRAVRFNFAAIHNLPGGYSSNQATLTEEFRLEGNSADGKLTFQVGGYYEDATPRGFIGSQSPTFIGCKDLDNLICTNFLPIPGLPGVNFTAAKNTFKSRGLYGQATYALSEQFKVTGGFRYTWDKVKSVSRRITYSFPFGVLDSPPLLPVVAFDPANPGAISGVSRCTDFTVRTPPLCELRERASFSAPTWLVGLDYNPTEDILVYGKYTRGYRTGSIKSDVPLEFHLFRPEKVDTFEVGLKTSFEGFLRGTFNVSGFYNDFSNQQIQLGFNVNTCRFTGPPVFDANGNCVANLPAISVPGNAGPVNVGKSRIWGIEADTRLHLFEGFTIDAGYTYLNTKVKEVVDVTLPSDNVYRVNAAVRAGDPLILSPKHKLTVTGTYRVALEHLGELAIGATYNYASGQISNYSALRDPTLITKTGGFNTSRLAPRNLVNANVNLENLGGQPVDVSFFVTNLFNEKYYTGINGLIGGLGFETATVGEARMWGFRLKYSFGGE